MNRRLAGLTGLRPADRATPATRDAAPGPPRSRSAHGWRAVRSRWGRPDPSSVQAGEMIAGLTAVAAALRAGAPGDQAWRRGLGVPAVDGVPEAASLLDRCGEDPALVAVVRSAAVLARDTGAPLAAVLDRVGSGLAEDLDAAARRTAALAGPQATARLLAWLPAVGLVLGLALGADPLGVLLDGRIGTVLLVVGGALTLLGSRWTRRLVVAAARRRDG